MARQCGGSQLIEDESRRLLIEQLARRYPSFPGRVDGGAVNTPGTSETRSAHRLRRYGVAAILTSASLLWGAAFAQLENGHVPPLYRASVTTALASEAGSGAASERMRVRAMHNARHARPLISV
jgi:hypothetical protein